MPIEIANNAVEAKKETPPTREQLQKLKEDIEN
jgi:hypothetical protein